MLTISWTSDARQAAALADFFVQYAEPNYISHGELQLGRALSPDAWSPSLRELLYAEFTVGAQSRPALDGVGRSISATTGDEVVGLAVVSFHESVAGAYAVLEDLLTAPQHRRQGFAREIVQWIEQQALDFRCTRIFLESGLRNDNAHAFFHSAGFETCSITMLKDLTRSRDLSGRRDATPASRGAPEESS